MKEKDDKFHCLVNKKLKVSLSVEEENQLKEYLLSLSAKSDFEKRLLNNFLEELLIKILDLSRVKAGDIVLVSYRCGNYYQLREELILKVTKGYLQTCSSRFSIKTGRILGVKSPFPIDCKIIFIFAQMQRDK